MTNSKHTWSVGDWLFCEFKLQQVTCLKQGSVTGVSDGWFELSSSSLNDRCFPLDRRVKVISDHFNKASSDIHRDGNRSLNYPDIHRWLVGKWSEACQKKDDDNAVREAIEEMEDFKNQLLKRSADLAVEKICGIPLFRQ